MSLTRDLRLQELLDRALEVPPDERRDVLAELETEMAALQDELARVRSERKAVLKEIKEFKKSR